MPPRPRCSPTSWASRRPATAPPRCWPWPIRPIPRPKKDTPAPTPPDAGLAIARVVPNGNADLNGIQAGDVLLTYAGTALKQHADLKTVAADAGPKKVPVTVLA